MAESFGEEKLLDLNSHSQAANPMSDQMIGPAHFVLSNQPRPQSSLSMEANTVGLLISGVLRSAVFPIDLTIRTLHLSLQTSNVASLKKSSKWSFNH